MEIPSEGPIPILLNRLRFASAVAGLAFNGFAIWEHNLIAIVLSFCLSSSSQFFNLFRHREKKNL